MNYCLDTNIIIDIFRGDPDLFSKISLVPSHQIVISTLTLAELYKGGYLSSKKEKSVQMIENFASSFLIVDFDQTSSKLFGKLWSKLQKKGKKTEEIDLMIASICIANDVTLITRNKKDFENIPNLEIEVW